MSRYMQELACRFHPHAELIEDSRAGDMICPMCGLVVGERMIDVSSEWRDFTDDTNSMPRSRVGAAQNTLFDGTDLETMTVPGKNSKTLDIDSGKPKYTKKITEMSSTDAATRNALSNIQALAERLHLTKRIVKQAALVFKCCYESKCLRGRSFEIIIASCIYTACRQENSPRTMREICEVSTVTLRDLGRCYNKIKQSLPSTLAPQSLEIKELVPRLCNQLSLQQEFLVRKTAMHIVERAQQICDIQGRAPSSIASAAIYMACLAVREAKTKKDIQGATGVSEGVIRDVYSIMLPHVIGLFPADFVFKCPPHLLPAH